MSETTPTRIERLFAGIARRGRRAGDLVFMALVAAVVLEIFAFAVLFSFRLIRPGTPALDGSPGDPRRQMSAYRSEAWSERYFDELHATHQTQYAPYTEYRRVPGFSGEHITLNHDSRRRTVPDCSSGKESLEVFFFGGSAVWGTGARDAGTIPSLLASRLCRGASVRITNFGESGYVSTQEVIQLQLELQSGRVPDIVIFYDGVNDVFSSYQNREAGMPQNVANRKVVYRLGRKGMLWNLVQFFRETNTGQFAEMLVKPFIYSRLRAGAGDISPEELENDTVDVLRGNVRIVQALGRAFGFESFFYWQPAVYSKTPLAPAEKRKIRTDPEYGRMFLNVIEKLRASGEVRDLSRAFDGIGDALFIDEFHVTEEGNHIIADAIFEDVRRSLARRLAWTPPSAPAQERSSGAQR